MMENVFVKSAFEGDGASCVCQVRRHCARACVQEVKECCARSRCVTDAHSCTKAIFLLPVRVAEADAGFGF